MAMVSAMSIEALFHIKRLGSRVSCSLIQTDIKVRYENGETISLPSSFGNVVSSRRGCCLVSKIDALDGDTNPVRLNTARISRLHGDKVASALDSVLK